VRRHGSTGTPPRARLRSAASIVPTTPTAASSRSPGVSPRRSRSQRIRSAGFARSELHQLPATPEQLIISRK
jgi:hypothetical protein